MLTFSLSAAPLHRGLMAIISIESPREDWPMVLLIDPYANRHLSMADIRLMNKVAGALAEAHDELDMSELAGAITSAYRPGMRAQALMMHIERDLRLEARRR